MKFVALFCAVVIAAEARPQDVQPQPVSNIAAEFEKFHQLWIAEAKRNSVAPVSPYKTASKANEPTVTESQPQPEPQFKPAEATQEPTATKSEAKPAKPATPAPDMNAAFANFHSLWKIEAARNAIAPSVEGRISAPLAATPVQQEPAQPVVEEQQPALAQEKPIEETPAVTPDYHAEVASFQKLWQQEAARNAIAPTFNPLPVAAVAPAAAVQPVAVMQSVAAPKAATPVVPVPKSAPTVQVIPASRNLFSNLAGGTQPLIVVLPNWSLSPSTTP